MIASKAYSLCEIELCTFVIIHKTVINQPAEQKIAYLECDLISYLYHT